MDQASMRLVAVSNRLPVSIKRVQDGWEVKPGSGGLVTAMAPVLSNRGGLWIGWPGTYAETQDESIHRSLQEASGETGYSLAPVNLTEDEVKKYYYGFANEVLWPLFHDLQTRCNFVPEYWHTYEDVNRKFAEVIANQTDENDYVWVHDYHLMTAGRHLKDKGVERSMGYFLHIPFPPMDIFMKLPWRKYILESLMEYDLIGFQTMRDRRNFVQCLRNLCSNVKVSGRGAVVSVNFRGRQVRVGAFPISIDYNSFSERAASNEVADRAWYIHEQLPDRTIILGVDRLDYTKGIPERLQAFEKAMERYPELHERVTLVQVVVPSREEVPEYQALRSEIERTVGRINGAHTRHGWVPIHYLYRSLEKDELLAYYRLSEIGLITPLEDGMNLVAKEYCSCSLEENGVLILSEFAGAAAQMKRDALIVNPYDIEGVANAIYEAWKMPQEERRRRMGRLRETVRNYDIFRWVDSFLLAAFARKLGDFPILEEFVPQVTMPGAAG